MDPRLEAELNPPVALIHRDGLYVVIAVLGVSILACSCVLTYSFSNYVQLKKNAEHVRSYIASRANGTDQHKIAGPRARKVAPNAASATTKAPVPTVPSAAGPQPRQGMPAPNASGVSTGHSAYGTSAVVVRQVVA